MALQLPGNLELLGNLELPGGITLESLYQISDQSIWFLIWIFKKHRFWPDLTRDVLEEPFIVERYYWPSGQISDIKTRKNNKYHSISRSWFKNEQLWWETNWKNDNQHGMDRCWRENGQLFWEFRRINGATPFSETTIFV